MTEKMIKQNAEAYADVFGRHMVDYYGVKDAFTSGAHSRDKEIKELKKKVSALETVIATARAVISTQETIIKEFRDPWISMEKLPIEGQDVLICLQSGVVIRNILMTTGDINYMKRNREYYQCWMPTPKPKGCEK